MAKPIKDIKDVVLDTSLPITTGANSLSRLSADNWTEERHKEAAAILAKIIANEAALHAMGIKYKLLISKLAQERGIEIEGVSRQKIPDVDGTIREVDVYIRIGEETTISTNLDKSAIHTATGYTVEDDPADPCVKKIRVKHPADWGLYRSPAAALEPAACIRAINNGKLDPSCSKVKTTVKFDVTYKITGVDELMKGGN